MAGNRRGRLKERFEGIHKNFDWVIIHCQECLKLIQDDNPNLSKAIKGLGKAVHELDKLAQSLYHKL